jgi:DNA-cytosine methyltransferase
VNVLSLFDGMSCGRIALERCGFPITNYFASEIDKFAIEVARANYPDTMHLGDVTTVATSEDGELIINDPLGIQTAKIDLLIGGSPCQGFSWAGKRLNFEDPRSALFFEYVRLLRELKPTWFLLENVNMKQEHQDVISEQLGVKPVRINSNLVSAQNRDRLYWTNIPVRSMPENKRVYLKDILEDGWTDREKSHCIDANYFKGGNLKSYFEKNRRQLVFDFAEDNERESTILVGEADLKGHDYNRRVYHPDGKAPTLAAASGGNLEPKILQVPRGRNQGGVKAKDGKVPALSGSSWEHNNFVLYPAAIVGRRLKDGVRDDNDTSVPITQCLEVHESGGKARCLSTVEKDTLVSPLPEGRYPDAYSDEMRLMWRKLTPIECERLQTVPDGYTAHVSNTQRYRMLGNGWTVDVICHLLEGMR